MEFPVLLDMEVPHIYAYPLNSVIAEKFEAIVSLGYANSRYKDFYDIYVLANNYNFDGAELKKGIEETFRHRKTGFEDIVVFEKGFVDDIVKKNRWNSFIKKKKAMILVNFGDTVNLIKVFLEPIVAKILSNSEIDIECIFRTFQNEIYSFLFLKVFCSFTEGRYLLFIIVIKGSYNLSCRIIAVYFKRTYKVKIILFGDKI